MTDPKKHLWKYRGNRYDFCVKCFLDRKDLIKGRAQPCTVGLDECRKMSSGTYFRCGPQDLYNKMKTIESVLE